MFDNKAILITGGTGSFGRQYAKTILERWAELGYEACGLRLEATNRIPHGRGMGSS